MRGCCNLTTNPYREGRVIYESPNFFVFSTLGSMGIEGYVLVASKEHFLGTGDVPDELHGELDELIQLTRARLREAYGKNVMMFEHGPRVGKCGWGGCIDHAHLHLVPGVDITDDAAVSLLRHLNDRDLFYRVDRVEGFQRACEVLEGGKTSYLIFENQAGERFVSEINFPGESQWLRKLTAHKVGTPHWNWREHPDIETAKKTAETLREFF